VQLYTGNARKEDDLSPNLKDDVSTLTLKMKFEELNDRK